MGLEYLSFYLTGLTHAGHHHSASSPCSCFLKPIEIFPKIHHDLLTENANIWSDKILLWYLLGGIWLHLAGMDKDYLCRKLPSLSEAAVVVPGWQRQTNKNVTSSPNDRKNVASLRLQLTEARLQADSAPVITQKHFHPAAFRNRPALPFKWYFICLFFSFERHFLNVATERNQMLFRHHCPRYNTCIFTEANNPSLPCLNPSHPQGLTVQLPLLPCYQQLLQGHIGPLWNANNYWCRLSNHTASPAMSAWVLRASLCFHAIRIAVIS